MWSIDCGGTGGAPCRDSGQWSKGHPNSMDGEDGSQNTPIDAWDRSRQRHVNRCGKGTQTKVALGQRSGELCVS